MAESPRKRFLCQTLINGSLCGRPASTLISKNGGRSMNACPSCADRMRSVADARTKLRFNVLPLA